MLEVDRRSARYKALFNRLLGGEQLTPEQVKAEMSVSAEEFDRVRQQHAAMLRSILFVPPSKIHADLLPKFNGPLDRARHLAVGDVMMGERPTGEAGTPVVTSLPTTGGETVMQAAEAWFAHLNSKPNKPREGTIAGRRGHVRAFVDKYRDLPLTEVTGQMAADFLDGLGRHPRTRNNYADTLQSVFRDAARRHRFSRRPEDNPFDKQRVKVGKDRKVQKNYSLEELQKLFADLPREVAPTEHTPETALPWAALIALYTGACLEEICQLTLDDIRQEKTNGGTTPIFDIHNGDELHKLKNEDARPRWVPVHSELVRLGLFDYIANVRTQGHKQLFPGLTRRPSKDNKIGCYVGDLLGKKVRKLGLHRPGLKPFHGFRHTVINLLKNSGVMSWDWSRVVGHECADTEGNKTYSEGYSVPGPGLAMAAGTVERIRYEGLSL
jgi:integrase